jgi:signal transduction histidine kinase/DNA-binding response OmpR family regulator
VCDRPTGLKRASPNADAPDVGDVPGVVLACASARRRRALARELERGGRSVVACESPAQALAHLRERESVLVVDAASLPLPGTPGGHGDASAPPIVALHDAPPDRDPAASLADGAHEYACWRPGRRFPIDRLDSAARRAAASEVSPEHLLAVVSHELRAPIGGVIGLCDLLLATRLDDEQREHVLTARLSADALLALTDQVVDLASIRAGRCDLEPADFRVRDLVEDVCTLLAPQAHAKGLELNCHVAPEGPAELFADAGRIRQILMNLVVNAIKYTRRGRVDVHAQVEQTAAGARLELDVCDTGAGIRDEDRRLLFRRFSQLRSSGGPRQGVGLGLAISAELARVLGAEIGLESTLGAGSRFRLSVPVAVTDQLDTTPDERPLEGCRVLVVDADTTGRLVARVYLTAQGARVDDVADAPAALTLLGDPELGATYDLVIFDMLVPGLDGLELASILRSRPELAELPLLTLTSLIDGSQRAALEALQVARLAKPVREHSLLRAVCGLLGRAMPHGRAAAQSAAPRPIPVAAGTRVLVADDDPVSQRLLRLRLTRLGCRVDLVGCGKSALAAALGRHYDLVLLDGHLPGFQGAEVAAELRMRAGPSQRTRIATMSASGAAPCPHADAAFAKPISVEDLIALLPARARAQALPLAERLGVGLSAAEAADLTARFLADARRRCTEARDHLSRGDLVRAADLGHLLRGACATAGADDLARLAAGVEAAAQRSAPEEALTLVSRLEAALALL